MCFITAGPITKVFEWGGRRVEDMCYERRRAEACVDESAHHVVFSPYMFSGPLGVRKVPIYRRFPKIVNSKKFILEN